MAIRTIEGKRKSRVITMIHRQAEALRLWGGDCSRHGQQFFAIRTLLDSKDTLGTRLPSGTHRTKVLLSDLKPFPFALGDRVRGVHMRLN